jgi:hypothetical protein
MHFQSSTAAAAAAAAQTDQTCLAQNHKITNHQLTFLCLPAFPFIQFNHLFIQRDSETVREKTRRRKRKENFNLSMGACNKYLSVKKYNVICALLSRSLACSPASCTRANHKSHRSIKSFLFDITRKNVCIKQRQGESKREEEKFDWFLCIEIITTTTMMMGQ